MALDSVQPVPWVWRVWMRVPAMTSGGLAGDHQRIFNPLALAVTALGEVSNPARCHPIVPAQRSQFGDIGRGQRGELHQSFEGFDGFGVGQRRAAGRHHHRIEHHRHV